MGPQEKTESRHFWTAEDILNANYEKHYDVIGRGLLPWNGQMIISGPASIGKSLARNELAIHLIMSWEWLGFEIPTPAR